MVLVGATEDPGFFTTAGAFQAELVTRAFGPGERSGAISEDAVVMRLSADSARPIASTFQGGEDGEQPAALALDPSGNPIIAGTTFSEGLPTWAPVRGPFSVVTGFISMLSADLTSPRLSTYSGDKRQFRIEGVAWNGADGAVLAGHTLEPEPLWNLRRFTVNESDVFVVRVVPEPRSGPRLDSVQNAASLLSRPLAPGVLVTLRGAGFGGDARAVVNGTPMENVSVFADRIVAVAPEDVDRETTAAVWVETAGNRSNTVLLPAASASPGIFTANGAGHGQAIALNEDGTLNSDGNRAAPGPVVTIAVTGMGRTVEEYGQRWPAAAESVYIGGWWTPVVGGEFKELVGVPGEVLLLRAPVPDPKLPHEPHFKIPDRVAVNVEADGEQSEPGVVIHLTQR